MFETAAAMMGERQNLELQLSEIDENAVMETHLNRARLTLSDILNTPCKYFFLLLMPYYSLIADRISFVVPDEQSHKEADKRATDALCNLTNSAGSALNTRVIVEIRQKHDSEVKKKHGNKQKRKQLKDVLDPVSNTDILSPSECSKLVAVLVKDSNAATDSSIPRMHRWNIHVKLNLADVQKNTTTGRDMTWLVGNGVISVKNPIKPMKFFLAICNDVSF